MKIETQPRDDHQVTLIVELEPEQMEGAKHRAARKISERKSVPGFRPGKAPKKMMEEKIGKANILQNAAEKTIQKTYANILAEGKIWSS